MIQAVSNRGELSFRVFEGSFTQAVYRDFLKRLAQTGWRPQAVLLQESGRVSGSFSLRVGSV